jgi:AraC-like DNA-binding protein
VDFNDKRISLYEAKPKESLKDFIETIWFMKWNIEDPEGLPCIVVPNPCSKFVIIQIDGKIFDPLLVGAHENADLFTYKQHGLMVGIDFRPGALYPFINKAMNDWPSSGILANELLPNVPKPTGVWNEEILSEWLVSFEDYLEKKLEKSNDNNYKKILSAIEGILNESLKTPEEIANLCSMSVRTLQRVFQKEVGVTPRDVLRIARFNRSIRQISETDFASFADIALSSGFFDQPHMANEFQKLVATPPSKFKRYI